MNRYEQNEKNLEEMIEARKATKENLERKTQQAKKRAIDNFVMEKLDDLYEPVIRTEGRFSESLRDSLVEKIAGLEEYEKLVVTKYLPHAEQGFGLCGLGLQGYKRPTGCGGCKRAEPLLKEMGLNHLIRSAGDREHTIPSAWYEEAEDRVLEEDPDFGKYLSPLEMLELVEEHGAEELLSKDTTEERKDELMEQIVPLHTKKDYDAALEEISRLDEEVKDLRSRQEKERHNARLYENLREHYTHLDDESVETLVDTISREGLKIGNIAFAEDVDGAMVIGWSELDTYTSSSKVTDYCVRNIAVIEGDRTVGMFTDRYLWRTTDEGMLGDPYGFEPQELSRDENGVAVSLEGKTVYVPFEEESPEERVTSEEKHRIMDAFSNYAEAHKPDHRFPRYYDQLRLGNALADAGQTNLGKVLPDGNGTREPRYELVDIRSGGKSIEATIRQEYEFTGGQIQYRYTPIRGIVDEDDEVSVTTFTPYYGGYERPC